MYKNLKIFVFSAFLKHQFPDCPRVSSDAWRVPVIIVAKIATSYLIFIGDGNSTDLFLSIYQRA